MQLCTLNSTLTVTIVFMLSFCMLLLFARNDKSIGDMRYYYNCTESELHRMAHMPISALDKLQFM